MSCLLCVHLCQYLFDLAELGLGSGFIVTRFVELFLELGHPLLQFDFGPTHRHETAPSLVGNGLGALDGFLGASVRISSASSGRVALLLAFPKRFVSLIERALEFAYARSVFLYERLEIHLGVANRLRSDGEHGVGITVGVGELDWMSKRW